MTAVRLHRVPSLLVSLLLGMGLMASWAGAAERVERSTILTLGKPSGEQVATYADDGSVRIAYEYNDRGRGPKLETSFALATDGTPTAVEVTGVNYLKAKVDERFSRSADGAVRWKNDSEDEQRAGPAPGFYASLNGPPEELVLLARAALKAADGKLGLLPVGEVRIEGLQEKEVVGADPANAPKITVRLYAMHGLGLTPIYLWLDHEQRFFATCSSWQSQVRSGYEVAVEALGKVQDQLEADSAKTRAQTLTHRIAAKQALLIDDVRVFDPVALTVTAGQAVLVRDGRIIAVGAKDQVKAPKDAQRWDGGGRFLMPGLWDMHVHVGDRTDGLLRLAGGVTTVRDMANDNDALKQRMAEIAAGTEIGPRILRAGFMDGRGPYAGPTKVFVDTEEEARAAVRMYADEGFQQIKVYSSMKPELIPLVIKLAHARGLRVSGHVPQGMSAQTFVEAGADELQHINFILLNFLAGPDVDTRTPQRFRRVAEGAADFDLAGQPMHALIQLLVERKTVLDPTLVAFEDMFLDRPGRMAPTWYHTVHRFPASWQRGFRAATGGLETHSGAEEVRHRESYRRMVDAVGLLHRAGVTLVAGTDAFPAFSLVRELELYVSAGIPPKEALRIATWNSARTMGMEQDHGQIAQGKVADLILVDGDPTLLVSDLHKVHRVLRGDRWYEPAKLYEAAGLKPR